MHALKFTYVIISQKSHLASYHSSSYSLNSHTFYNFLCMWCWISSYIITVQIYYIAIGDRILENLPSTHKRQTSISLSLKCDSG